METQPNHVGADPAAAIARGSAVPVAPKSRARFWMILATVFLAIAQALPFGSSASIEDHYTGDRYDRSTMGDVIGYRSTVEVRYSTGFQENSWAWLEVAILVALFLTPLYRRPGWTRWNYWVGLLMAVGLAGLPPPLNQMGGIVAALGLALAVYAVYRRSKEKAAGVAA